MRHLGKKQPVLNFSIDKVNQFKLLLSKLNMQTIGDLANYDVNLLKGFIGIVSTF